MGGKDPSPYGRTLYNRVARPKIPNLRKSQSNGKVENSDQIAPSHFPKAHYITQKNPEKTRFHRKNAIFVSQILEIGHFKKPCNKNDAPADRHGTWRDMSKDTKKEETNALYYPAEAWVMAAPSSKKPEEREFAIDFGALMYMLSKRDLRSGELETLRRSRNAKTVVTANGEVQTNEEA